MTAYDDRNHPDRPLRASTYAALDALRRRAQEDEEEAKRLRQPEPGIYAATYPIPDLGEPTERLLGSSPLLGLPFETLIWKVACGPAVVFRRMKVRCHGFDDG